MKPLPHVYEVTLSGGPKGYATLSTGGVPALRPAPPKDFDGPGDAWSPEHLLLASVENCFMLTFQAIAQASKFEFLSLELSGSGTVDREDGSTRFTDIVLRSRLALPKGGDPERAKRMLEKGKNAYLVTASLFVPIRLESVIVVEPGQGPRATAPNASPRFCGQMLVAACPAERARSRSRRSQSAPPSSASTRNGGEKRP